MRAAIKPLAVSELALLGAHLRRHRAESGRGDPHFMPFAPDDADGPTGLAVEALARPLRVPGWQRWWVAFTDDGSIVGHVNLKGPGLKVQMHRCLLGIGVERAYRRSGLGRGLMQAAIEFARDVEALRWIDLSVFAHNVGARALYTSLGFVEIGVFADCFRIEGESIDDVVMTLAVG